MNILTRYLIRAHAGPFLFALTALTGLLFLNAVAQRLKDLAGKGLTWDVITEFLVYSLPHTVALTLPMTVLVAVLYAFSDLAANNEITAMKAGGVRPQRLMLPLLGVGTIIALVMLFFNDQVLPEANHRLRNLLLDINRKSPTFTLREQVVNRIESVQSGDRFFLQATRIDNATSTLHDVVIVDSNDPLRYRTTVADSGFMAFNAARTDLYLTLFNGAMYESSNDPPGSFQQVLFAKEIIPLRGIGNEMERQVGADRGDREMTLQMLADRAEEREIERAELLVRSRERTRLAVLAALGESVPDSVLGRGWAARSRVARPQSGGDERTLWDRDDISQRASLETRQRAAQAKGLSQFVNRHRVEIHKKITLAVACVVFVLIGGPLATRFPRGGLGTVIAASSAIFAVYWMGLIGGETLADRGVAPPGLTMWIPNLVFTALGVVLLARMGREPATARGGGWEDVVVNLRRSLTGAWRRRSPRPASSEAAD